jgi:beta-mannosidase
VDFENFVYLSQVQQGLAIKTAVTHWRGLKPHCMGTLIWQLNDTWPVCSWSSLDHGGGWKLLHHMARDFYAPVTVVVVPGAESFDLRVVNDTAAPVALELDAYATAMDGSVRHLGTYPVTAEPDRAHSVATVPRGDVLDNEVLATVWHSKGGRHSGDVFAPKPWKSYDLLPPRLKQEVAAEGAGWKITISAEALALYVALESDRPGRFSMNAFAIFPGYPAEVTFTPSAPGPAPNFTLRDLHSATYGSP